MIIAKILNFEERNLVLKSSYPKTHFPEITVNLWSKQSVNFQWFNLGKFNESYGIVMIQIWRKPYKTSIKFAKKGHQQLVFNFKVSHRSTYFLNNASFFPKMATINIISVLLDDNIWYTRFSLLMHTRNISMHFAISRVNICAYVIPF